jgi:hypothetical protein
VRRKKDYGGDEFRKDPDRKDSKSEIYRERQTRKRYNRDGNEKDYHARNQSARRLQSLEQKGSPLKIILATVRLAGLLLQAFEEPFRRELWLGPE